MKNTLSAAELNQMIQSVFSPNETDKGLAILVDVPDTTVLDNEAWRQRRVMAQDWVIKLQNILDDLSVETVTLFAYPNVHNNNADLPEIFYTIDQEITHTDADILLSKGKPIPLKQLLSQYQLLMAMTEFSATAPLKLLAKNHTIRAATMPGFSERMLPALKLDYEKIHNRVEQVKHLVDEAISITILFNVMDKKSYTLNVDTRFRKGNVSSGRFPEAGQAGNFPSGECYIVPYEGELKEDSQTEGILPVQFDEEVVLYRILKNKAIGIISEGRYSEIEHKKIKAEPAYANIAEIGFGVLNDFGIQPIGQMLLDEKLSLHIAFGRSDHFGGAVGAKDFSSPSQVIHIDRIYLPELQDKVNINEVNLNFDEKDSICIMKNNQYTIF